MRRKLIFFLFFLLILIIPATAVKPVAVAQESLNIEGLQIEFPKILNHQQGQPMNFYFHVFNTSDGVPVVKGISCDLHVYNSTGSHVFLDTKTSVESDEHFDYEFQIPANNFSLIQQMSYIMSCNDTVRGGFVSVPFNVNATGQDQSELYFLIIIFIIPVLLGLFSLVGSYRLDEDHSVFKIGLFLFSMTCFFASLWLSHIIVATLYPTFTALLSFISYLTWVYGIVFSVIIMYFLIYAFAKMIHRAAQKDAEDEIKY